MIKTQNSINYDNLETLKEMLGAEALLQELMQAMSSQEAKENIEHIARMHDIEITTQGDE